ncbi:hypothetical protein A2642_03045 [Candidatus Nomurabacteria bacterium RIFCSPHIGHO2_01_FULL_39_10]|uniref:DUF192 domain-containing protein n=1 Tax=Candidatus Nomurabacteria bacterium RIFCSPHIGHO2_01_FULL_39_10 TaxID=1801733 RepID=A0A1F6V764_9BACT|nr:MAG: hypothetical protein A2642_03045 [Candidatus Nomurabacteria bacterium RIFCSPHIGHO2_01_FULL_39_10]
MITNLTQNKLISEHELRANTFLKQALGLMFRIKKHNLIMTFPTPRKISLHNFFVFYPLDILLLNEKKEIIEIKHNFKPFTFYNGNKNNKAKYVIELAHRNNNYQSKDKVEF